MDVIETLDELDARLALLDQAQKVSDAALRAEFDKFRMRFPVPTGLDPDSEAYRDQQFALYERIAGKPYALANEASKFDPKTVADRPFPYYTEGFEVIGDQMIATGFIIKTMRLPPGASILEFGPGWGNTTIALARSGYDVTCLEIEPNFISLIEERARRLSLPVKTVQGDFLDAANLGRTFDAVLFFECFHHCARHNDLLDMLDRLVNPGGIVVFAAEPITSEFPMPWGLRSDGQTLWAIRNFGWLELGFNERYFFESLNRRGWSLDRQFCKDTSIGTVLIARRRAEGIEIKPLRRFAKKMISQAHRVLNKIERSIA